MSGSGPTEKRDEKPPKRRRRARGLPPIAVEVAQREAARAEAAARAAVAEAAADAVTEAKAKQAAAVLSEVKPRLGEAMNPMRMAEEVAANNGEVPTAEQTTVRYAATVDALDAMAGELVETAIALHTSVRRRARLIDRVLQHRELAQTKTPKLPPKAEVLSKSESDFLAGAGVALATLVKARHGVVTGKPGAMGAAASATSATGLKALLSGGPPPDLDGDVDEEAPETPPPAPVIIEQPPEPPASASENEEAPPASTEHPAVVPAAVPEPASPPVLKVIHGGDEPRPSFVWTPPTARRRG